ncbi:MAG TPA: hypothetical protein VGL06_23605 [Pseudonocardiaceae bacterium]|jgi:cyanobactin biosynthesis protein (PatB/AcyB/McaB family)
MNQPIQAPPVRRPDLVDPATCYDVDRLTDDQRSYLQMRIALDSNFNDPQAFAVPSAEQMKVSAWPMR